MSKAIVLLSAGLDSTVNLSCALRRGDVTLALTFDYGQRSAGREIAAAAEICKRLRVRHEVVRLPWLARITHCALVDRKKPLPRPSAGDLDDPRRASRTAARVWVPNRNGVFIAVAAAFAEALGADEIAAGFNAEEAATFPDNSPEFISACNRLLSLSTMSGVRVRSYTSRLRKPDIIAFGMRVGAPLDMIWCCYEGGRIMCGGCESCVRFMRAAEESGQAGWFAANHPRIPRSFRRRHIG